jgi:MFS transporter, ACS family, tartrate transporter
MPATTSEAHRIAPIAPVPRAVTPEIVTRKVRRRIVPFVFILFIIAALDRNNIGFAALTMNAQLGIDSQQYGFIAGMFFPGYILFEVPSNLLLYRLGARTWIARILISWGVVAIATGFVQTATHLYVARFLLGVAEAGYFPGILLYLTYWFRQRELGHTIALFFTANAVANIVGAPVSGAILDHVHWFGIASWRWLLILEGLPAVLGGIVTYSLLPSRPAEATFLSVEEKEWLTAELALEEREKLAGRPAREGSLFADRRLWHLTVTYFMVLVGFWVLTFWMPLMLKNLSGGYSNTSIGLFVMIPYLTALVVMIAVGRSSDARLERRFHSAVPLIVAALALVGLVTSADQSLPLSILLWCFVASGIYSIFGPFWSLPSEFLTGYAAAAGIALINCLGNVGGFVGPYAVGAINKTTGSFHGGLVFASAALLVSALLLVAFRQARPQLQQ